MNTETIIATRMTTDAFDRPTLMTLRLRHGMLEVNAFSVDGLTFRRYVGHDSWRAVRRFGMGANIDLIERVQAAQAANA